MDGASPWGYPDESPLDGLNFLLRFQGETPRTVFVEQGRVVYNFEMHDEVCVTRVIDGLISACEQLLRGGVAPAERPATTLMAQRRGHRYCQHSPAQRTGLAW